MISKKKQDIPSWTDVKTVIYGFDKKQLIELIGDIYRLSLTNKDFFHTRFELCDDPLSSYKQILQNSLNPDHEDRDYLDFESANDALSRYSKAVDNPKGESELMVFYVECGNSYTLSHGDIDQNFYDSLLEVYGNATETVLELPANEQKEYRDRLFKIMHSASGIGRGYYDGLYDLFYGAFPKEN
ncbi:hypothetical protein KKA14_10720 [bacterium]|nr:hypothetical protein [bacterium]